MLTNYNNSLELLIDSQNLRLYNQLINQLNKDFNSVSINVAFSKNNKPSELKENLQITIKKLIEIDFNTFTNLLYRVDISENNAKNSKSLNLEEYSTKIAFLILKRALQKVWFKNQYSK